MPSDNDLRQLGEMLQRRREQLGWSRVELARRGGVSPAYVALIEDALPRAGGRPSRPSERLLRGWVEALGMKGSEGETPLGLAGYPPLPGGADTGTGETSAATERRIRESRGGYELDPLVDELRTLLALADEVGLRRDAEDAVRPLLALLRFRLEGAP